MTFRQALKIFRTEILTAYKQRDATTVRCMFNDWIDGLYRDGEITERQVNTWCYPEPAKRRDKMVSGDARQYFSLDYLRRTDANGKA
jgi:hypothetical protein